MKILIYDCEIQNCIPSKDGFRNPDLKYCKGWGDFEGMGISCIGWAWLYGESGVFSDSELGAFNELLWEADRLIGFNSKSFDDRLVLANDIKAKTDWDLLEETRLAAYGSTSWQDTPKGFTYKLDALARTNLQNAKTGSGELAPILYQNGRIRELHEYCLQDVKLTHDLVDRVLTRSLVDPNNGNYLDLDISSLSDS